MRDAASRSSLLLDAGASGHDGGFFIESPSGDFRLEPSGFVQFRSMTTVRDGERGADDIEHTFQTRRMRISMRGHVLDPSLEFKVTLSAPRGDDPVRLSDAWANWSAGNGLSIRWGQFKLPLLAEELMSAKRQLAVDRSFTNRVFTQNRSQAVQIEYETPRWRLAGAFSDGLGSRNTDLLRDPADWAVTGRIEALLAGEFRQFRAFTSPPGASFGALLGAAAHFERSPDTPAGGPEDLFQWTADVNLQGDGWSAFAAAIGRHTSAGNNGSPADDFGLVAQGGVYIAESLEPFARFDLILPDGDRSGDDPFPTVTLGANWYFHGHSAKLTVDAQWFLADAVGTDLVSTDTAIGFLDAGADSGQVAIRAQFQLVF